MKGEHVMGTNYYFMCRDKDLVHENFIVKNDQSIECREYELVEAPYLGYEIHLNKLSMGWRPLFQRHKVFNTFNELKNFYFANEDKLEIYDEYGRVFTWDEYFKKVHSHSLRERVPRKWVYEPDEIFGDERPTLHTKSCLEEEAELFIPYDHVLYDKSEREAKKRFGVCERFNVHVKYWNDPDYLFDWTEGEFC